MTFNHKTMEQETKKINLSSVDWNNLSDEEFQFYAKELNKLTSKKSKVDKKLSSSSKLVLVKLNDGNQYAITEKLFDRLNKMTSEKSRTKLIEEIKDTHEPHVEMDIMKF